MTPIENYERSYNSMWVEIYRAREQRDELRKLVEGIRDLQIALRHDMGTGTKLSEPTIGALMTVERALASGTDQWE